MVRNSSGYLPRRESLLEQVEFGEAELFSSLPDDFFNGYREEDCDDKSMGRAYTRMFNKIAF